MFGTRCAACGDDLEPTDWVRHVGDSIYHISCFTCSVCGVEMATGDECMIRDSALLCRAHGMLGLRNDDEHDTRENEKGRFIHYENLPMQYTEIFKIVKNENFFDIFLVFAQNIDFGYT